MSTYTIRYNRSSIHIDGLRTRTNGSGRDMGDHVSYWAESSCAALTRGASRMGFAGTSDDVAEILKMAKGKSIAIGNKMCKNCEAAAEAMIAANEN